MGGDCAQALGSVQAHLTKSRSRRFLDAIVSGRVPATTMTYRNGREGMSGQLKVGDEVINIEFHSRLYCFRKPHTLYHLIDSSASSIYKYFS